MTIKVISASFQITTEKADGTPDVHKPLVWKSEDGELDVSIISGWPVEISQDADGTPRAVLRAPIRTFSIDVKQRLHPRPDPMLIADQKVEAEEDIDGFVESLVESTRLWHDELAFHCILIVNLQEELMEDPPKKGLNREATLTQIAKLRLEAKEIKNRGPK